ncbi:MAG TPA: FadR/GntR family transcriptional regulator [Smithella sp.]|nr:FadR/GntR family transcriptional regulator [Smithella sp.]
MNLELAPVEKMKAPEQIAEMLLKYILGGGVSPGEKLPPERVLAAQLNVTRATLREALKKLEQLKLIVIHQGKGIIVEDFHKASIDLIFSLLVINGQIDLKILENILEARELFGTDVARCAARRAEQKDIEQMKTLMEKLILTTDPGKLQQLDFEFFRQLALASKNIVYILLMNTIKTIHDTHLDLFLPLTTNLDTTLQQAILQAVIDGNEEEAAEKARTFLQAGMELLKFLNSVEKNSKE